MASGYVKTPQSFHAFTGYCSYQNLPIFHNTFSAEFNIFSVLLKYMYIVILKHIVVKNQNHPTMQKSTHYFDNAIF